MSRVQILEDQAGNPAFAVVPIDVWSKVAERAEMIEDVAAYDDFKLKDDGFRIPDAVVAAQINGASPIAAWREHLGLSQKDLADSAGISAPFLSQIENGHRQGGTKVLKAIACVLDVPVDVLIDD